jgi:LysR family hydrogen peroxide-inducible transcriptional activator
MRVDEGPQLILSQFSSLLNMVGAGMGVSVIPEMAVEKNSRCHYVRIADESARRTIGATVLRGRFLTRVFRSFLAHLHPAI